MYWCHAVVKLPRLFIFFFFNSSANGCQGQCLRLPVWKGGELWAGCWGAPEHQDKVLAELLPELSVHWWVENSMSQAPEQPSHLGVTFSEVPTSPELPRSPQGSSPVPCHPLGPRNLPWVKFLQPLGSCDGRWVPRGAPEKSGVSPFDFSVCPAPRSTLNTEYLAMEFLHQQYFNCWFFCPFKPPSCPYHPLSVTSLLSVLDENRALLSAPQAWRIFANNSSPESWHLPSPPVPVITLGMALWITGTIQHPWERPYKPLHHLLNALPNLLQWELSLPLVELMPFFILVVTVSSQEKDVSFNYSIYLHMYLLLWTGRENTLCLPHTLLWEKQVKPLLKGVNLLATPACISSQSK